MDDDTQLLERYAQDGSEAAFRQLVERQIGLVYATARRIVRDAHIAEDVTQTVFTDLARKARTLSPDRALGGWLHRHTCFVAAKAMRTENRRRARERTAMELQAINEPTSQDETWAQLAPLLDNALDELAEVDRDAVVLRYLQGRDLRSIGHTLGASDNAVQKRLVRALEKLRAILTRRGVTLSSALLANALDAGAASTSPAPGLAATISSTALHQAAIAPATFHPLKTMKTSTWAIITAAILAVGVVTFVILKQAGLPDSSAGISPPVSKATALATAPTKASAVSLPTAKVETPQVAPAPTSSAIAPTTTPNPPDAQADMTNVAAPSAASAAAPAAASPPPGDNSGTGNNAGTPTQWLTVTNGQLTMTTLGADGTIGTVPYKEMGATTTIAPGTRPNEYIVTFYRETDGKIVARLTRVPDSAEIGPNGYPAGNK